VPELWAGFFASFLWQHRKEVAVRAREPVRKMKEILKQVQDDEREKK
jgi:hypothetical protein